MTDPVNSHTLLDMRKDNIGRLFQRAARHYSELALQKLANYGHDKLTLFHTALISNLDIEGTNISVLAERAGMTKQAMGQVAKELEERGYIRRATHTSDKRAVLLYFTDDGYRFLEDAYRVKLEIEAEFATIIGGENMVILRELLAKIVADST